MKPQPDEYRTRAEYRWALRKWRKAHGGYIWLNVILAFAFGVLTGNATLTVGLVMVAFFGSLYVRSKP